MGTENKDKDKKKIIKITSTELLSEQLIIKAGKETIIILVKEPYILSQ